MKSIVKKIACITKSQLANLKAHLYKELLESSYDKEY